MKDQIETYQQSNVMLFTRLMDKLNKLTNLDEGDGSNIADHESLLIFLNKIPCQAIPHLDEINDALVQNKNFKKLLVNTYIQRLNLLSFFSHFHSFLLVTCLTETK